MATKRNILIVGATGAMGRAVSKKLAEDPNVQLILMGRNTKKLEQLSDGLQNEPILIPLNLLGATPNDYETLRENLAAQCEALHGIVFAAADLVSLTPLEHYQIGQWYNVMQVGLHAPFLIVHAFLPLLKMADAANLVFLTDEIAENPKAYWGAYAVAETGKLQLAKLLQAEMPESIGVHTVALDRFKSGITQKAFPGLFLEGKNPFPEADEQVNKIVSCLF